jgi:hypothetical protein
MFIIERGFVQIINDAAKMAQCQITINDLGYQTE